MSYNQDLIYDFIKEHPGCSTHEVAQHTGITCVARPLRALGRDGRVRYEVVSYHGAKRYWVVP